MLVVASFRVDLNFTGGRRSGFHRVCSVRAYILLRRYQSLVQRQHNAIVFHVHAPKVLAEDQRKEFCAGELLRKRTE